MPVYPLDNGETLNECIHRLAYEGLKIQKNGHLPKEYKERLDFELEVIRKMGCNSYFLIVADFTAIFKKGRYLNRTRCGSFAL
ncbi:hypothetical protein C7Y47_15125 [Lysinibacillus sphaericus]|uniref:Bacterial DNA polymerase III alpha subunit NTPase domain-containing protein n=1 Tax=Lysinibacillus sphaericus TaxID=1421 RepID=A0A544UEK6_LYSSH|nr:hypothetical protein C7Y47_15125 [Lysinibacillus sp. SDF0037]